MHKPGHPRCCAHLSRRVQGTVQPPAHAGDPAQVGVVGADERLQLVFREAAGLWHSVEKGWDDDPPPNHPRLECFLHLIHR
eukprot:356460-Chlamydomonas_euryale.AAC.7